MNRVIAASIVFVLLICIGLYRTSPLPLPSKPVIFHYNNTNNNSIDRLGKFTYAAHRGAPIAVNKPENSLSAFKASKQLGYKIVEADLRLTKDGKWIILHDYTLDRTTTGKGTVKSKPFNKIKKLKLQESDIELLFIPTLDDFLNLCKTEGLIPILDIKPEEKEFTSEHYNSLLTALNNNNLLDKSIFTSSSKQVLSELRARNSLTPIAAMIDVSPDNIEFVKNLTNTFFYLNYSKLTEDKIALLTKNNLKFGVWTINDEATAQYFLDKGAFMIVTDSLLEKK